MPELPLAETASAGEPLHEPVLLAEVLELLAVKADGIYLDVTVGTAGHARAIRKLLGPGGLLVGMDRDPEVLALARRRLEAVDSSARLVFRQANFASLPEVCEELSLNTVHGVLADLGVSSWHLERGERGFSHTLEGPLDMRFDRSETRTAADLLARLSAAELTELLFRYGEESRARLIARAVVRRRTRHPLKTTTELAEVIRSVVPARARSRALARTFQALRIAVNRELESLQKFLEAVPRWLAPGGRLVVISFHSLEDRLVKRALAQGERAGILRLLTAKPLRPGAEEVSRNPRSRSARLRAAEKLLLSGAATSDSRGGLTTQKGGEK